MHVLFLKYTNYAKCIVYLILRYWKGTVTQVVWVLTSVFFFKICIQFRTWITLFLTISSIWCGFLCCFSSALIFVIVIKKSCVKEIPLQDPFAWFQSSLRIVFVYDYIPCNVLCQYWKTSSAYFSLIYGWRHG